jgi:hypothetical protein
MPRDYEPIPSLAGRWDSPRARGRKPEPAAAPAAIVMAVRPVVNRIRVQPKWWVRVSRTLALVVLLAGCSGSSGVRDKLLQASQDADAAVHTGVAALKLLEDGRITHAVAQTALIDMAKEVSKSADSITKVELSRPDDAALRDTVRTATDKGTTAVLAGRDCLQLKVSCQPAADQLQKAASDLDGIVAQLRGSQ